MHIHMAMTPIPYSLGFSIDGSIGGRWWGCQMVTAIWNQLLMYDNIVLCHNIAMSASRARSSRVFTISFPEELAKQVVAVADEESRNISELFREAFRTYRLERMRNRLDAIRAEAAQRVTHSYTEDDVEALVDEIRSENFRKKKQIA